MKDEVAKLLAKADRALRAAEKLLEGGDPDFALGRAYYAMFYAAEALLRERGLRFRKHSGVHAAFGENLVKGGDVEAKYHRWLLEAFDRRIAADYGADSDAIPAAEAREVIDRARGFVSMARAQVK